MQELHINEFKCNFGDSLENPDQRYFLDISRIFFRSLENMFQISKIQHESDMKYFWRYFGESPKISKMDLEEICY